MENVLDLKVNKNAQEAYIEKKYSISTLLKAVSARLILFAIIQALFYFIISAFNPEFMWEDAAIWWPFVVVAANFICVVMLDKLLIREGSRYSSFFVFEKGTILKDILLTSGLLLLLLPISYAPNVLLSKALFGDFAAGGAMIFKPLPLWGAIAALVLFPITMPFGELPVYFGYVMPRLEVITGKKWLALTIPALFLSLQHISIPLLFDANFIIWRALMFLPFAFLIGLIILRRPRLFPYILIGHFLMDLSAAISLLMISIK